MEFAEDLSANFATAKANPAQAEDQLKAPTTRLLKKVGEVFGLEIVARTEAKADGGVRPDLGVTVNGLLAGHIELKAPGKGAQPKRFSDPHDKEQFKKLSDHPNLIYTDGNEWALFRNGALVENVVQAPGDVTDDAADAIDDDFAAAIEALLRNFFSWQPIVPSTPKALAEMLAPLTRLLRETVEAGLEVEGSALSTLADEWREYFFAEADDDQFADAYAQTVTYALLLARVEGETDIHARAVERLERRHGLLAHVLRWLSDPTARNEVAVPVDLLERAIAEIDPEELARRSKSKDLWLYFYEDFLTAYDPRGRKQRGVYYTPAAVVNAQVALVDDLLTKSFDKSLGIADDDVTLLDPAVGTGTYLLAAIEQGTRRIAEQFGAGAVGARASAMAERFFGFELLIGAYAVCHMRVAQQLLGYKAKLPDDGLQVFLTDTLESPNIAPPGLAGAPLFHKKLADENERARHVKHEQPILVCIGNPPYYRQTIGRDEHDVERQGGWVRFGDRAGDEPILSDFLRDTPGEHAKSLYNLYVYFWRWALWKVFERPPGRGVVAFITASSYLRGPGFKGMRRHMREVFDELWILDLGGEGRGARKSDNVFDIQTPVAIAIGVRSGEGKDGDSATVRYARIDGTRESKYEQLWAIDSLSAVEWEKCFDGWTEPMLPKGDAEASYWQWPLLTDVFPWQHSGTQFKRTWPISTERASLENRWRALVSASDSDQASLFRETDDRNLRREGASWFGGEILEPIGSLNSEGPTPPIVGYAYRSLDRQYCLSDDRVCSRPRPPLWRAHGAKQLYLTSLLTGVLGNGPAAIVAHNVPDMDHFRGSYGAKHVVPLWRDREGVKPNVAAGLLNELSSGHGADRKPVDLFGYTYAVLQAPSYTQRFADELEIPGPRIPLTRDAALFERAESLGRELIWLHTFGERLIPAGSRPAEVPQGSARSRDPIGSEPGDYPTSHSYDPSTKLLTVGTGTFGPIEPEVWNFEVSGLHVLKSWLDYRMRDGAGKKSSPLDGIRPTIWPAEFTEELLKVIWILERTVALGEALDEALSAIIDGETFTAEELPKPSDEERKPPA